MLPGTGAILTFRSIFCVTTRDLLIGGKYSGKVSTERFTLHAIVFSAMGLTVTLSPPRCALSSVRSCTVAGHSLESYILGNRGGVFFFSICVVDSAYFFGTKFFRTSP